jgi:hypothetical protein
MSGPPAGDAGAPEDFWEVAEEEEEEVPEEPGAPEEDPEEEEREEDEEEDSDLSSEFEDEAAVWVGAARSILPTGPLPEGVARALDEFERGVRALQEAGVPLVVARRVRNRGPPVPVHGPVDFEGPPRERSRSRSPAGGR